MHIFFIINHFYLPQFHPNATMVAGLAGEGRVKDSHGRLAAEALFQSIVQEKMVKGVVGVSVFVVDGPGFPAGIPGFQAVQAVFRFSRPLDDLQGAVRRTVIEVSVQKQRHAVLGGDGFIQVVPQGIRFPSPRVFRGAVTAEAGLQMNAHQAEEAAIRRFHRGVQNAPQHHFFPLRFSGYRHVRHGTVVHNGIFGEKGQSPVFSVPHDQDLMR